MTNKELVLSVHRDMGRNDALNLAQRANDMTPTQVIEEETKVPMSARWAVTPPTT